MRKFIFYLVTQSYIEKAQSYTEDFYLRVTLCLLCVTLCKKSLFYNESEPVCFQYQSGLLI